MLAQGKIIASSDYNGIGSEITSLMNRNICRGNNYCRLVKGKATKLFINGANVISSSSYGWAVADIHSDLVGNGYCHNYSSK